MEDISQTTETTIAEIIGDPVFSNSPAKWVRGESFDQIKARVLDVLNHVANLEDHRLLVLVGGLLVEGSVDGLLSVIMPGYKSLQDHHDFSFSLRIAVGRALGLCPAIVWTSADVVRRARNEFVHELSMCNFDTLKPNLIAIMRHCFQGFSKESDLQSLDPPAVFKHLVLLTAFALETYRAQLFWLNRFIRNDECRVVLDDFVRRNMVEDK